MKNQLIKKLLFHQWNLQFKRLLKQDLELNNLKRLIDSLPTLEVVDLSENHITNVDILFFSQKHLNLRVVNISGNAIAQSVPSAAIVDMLPRLQILDISHNLLESIHRQYPIWLASGRDKVLRFGDNPVQSVLWDVCSLESLPSDLFTLNLTFLGLSGNNLPFLDERVSQFEHLKGIDVFSNVNINPTYPDVLNTIKSLEQVRVGGASAKARNYTKVNYVDSVTVESIEELSFGYAGIRTHHLSNWSSLRTNLKILDLEGNAFVSLTDINEFSQLEKVYMPHNSLWSFPSNLSRLSKLEEIDLKYNNLIFLPPEIANLSSLRMLDVRGNDALQYGLGEELPRHLFTTGAAYDRYFSTWVPYVRFGKYPFVDESSGAIEQIETYIDLPPGQVIFNATTTKRIPDAIKLKCNASNIECLPREWFRIE